MKRIHHYLLTIGCLLVLGVIGVQASLATPHKVTHLRSTSKTDTTITLKWKDQAQADRYQIRITKPNGKLLKKVWTHKRSKTVTDLKSATRYSFKVRAEIGKKSRDNFGQYSKTVYAQTEPEPATPVLFGFWGLNGYHTADGLADVQTRLNATVFQVASGSGTNYTVNTFLPMVKASGMKVTLRLSGGQSEYTTAGSFDLAEWKALVARWEGSGIQAYIDDGTLVGHMLLDDIDTYSVTDATAADLEEMARYSEEILPGLMTYVRQKCSRMPTPSVNAGQYIYVDNCVNQYTNYQGYSDGPIANYVIAQKGAADSLGLGVINGLNIADGGDGSSGQAGWSNGKYAMSADEITEYGTALLAMEDVQMFLMWEYDGQELWYDGTTIGSDYFDQPELQAALADLGALAAE